MKYSRQRELVFQAVRMHANHPTADDVFRIVREKYPNISLATVYRNLNQLTERQKLLKIPVPNGSDHFDHQTHSHLHVICQKCGKMEDIAFELPDQMKIELQSYANMRITEYQLLAYGICSECTQENTNMAQ